MGSISRIPATAKFVAEGKSGRKGCMGSISRISATVKFVAGGNSGISGMVPTPELPRVCSDGAMLYWCKTAMQWYHVRCLRPCAKNVITLWRCLAVIFCVI
eukprot:scaffold86653_cov19-Tisochrysis_lutea.AAC.3